MYSKAEWRDFIYLMRPDISDAEFERLWAGFLVYREQRLARHLIN